MTIDAAKIAELRELLSNLDPVEWVAHGYSSGRDIFGEIEYDYYTFGQDEYLAGECREERNAKAIVTMRNVFVDLLDELERLRTENDRLVTGCDEGYADGYQKGLRHSSMANYKEGP